MFPNLFLLGVSGSTAPLDTWNSGYRISESWGTPVQKITITTHFWSAVLGVASLQPSPPPPHQDSVRFPSSRRAEKTKPPLLLQSHRSLKPAKPPLPWPTKGMRLLKAQPPCRPPLPHSSSRPPASSTYSLFCLDGVHGGHIVTGDVACCACAQGPRLPPVALSEKRGEPAGESARPLLGQSTWWPNQQNQNCTAPSEKRSMTVPEWQLSFRHSICEHPGAPTSSDRASVTTPAAPAEGHFEDKRKERLQTFGHGCLRPVAKTLKRLAH